MLCYAFVQQVHNNVQLKAKQGSVQGTIIYFTEILFSVAHIQPELIIKKCV